ncbi:MAG: AAA domain-containing protein [Bacteroidota bacterium]
MQESHPYQSTLLQAIDFELKEQEKRFVLENNTSLKQLKAMGVALHPISVTRKSFGYADYPEISFRIPFISEVSNFKDNCAIECFIEGEQAIKGILLNIDGQKGEFRLFTSDFPDWIEERGVGIKLTPDEHTFDGMKEGIKNINSTPDLLNLFNNIHGTEVFGEFEHYNLPLVYKNEKLNESQKEAIQAIVNNEDMKIVHGPPGTGKTTTLIESIYQLILKGEKILVAAPSNTAVDNIAKGLLSYKIKILRIGNVNKVDAELLANTPEGKMAESKEQKEIKKLKIRAEELRRMAHQYKRNFGREESNQRNLLLKEVKKIRGEIRKIREYFYSSQFEQADVILGTPIGLNDNVPKDFIFDTLFIDEAGQTLEPLAWLIFPFAQKWVLAGDPFQLPPTVLSNEASKLGFSDSILEKIIQHYQGVYFLNTQYRMRKSIAEFSSTYFYDSKLLSPENKQDTSEHVLFYDTAGTGFQEETGEDGFSLVNTGELNVIKNILEAQKIDLSSATFISPYSAQIELAKKTLPKEIKVKTIDSFQGQENDTILISLVRSNSEANIGFLNDYRRMNVALTRAKEKLIVVGDSSTLANDKFYEKFLSYVETIGGYRSAWEYLYVE